MPALALFLGTLLLLMGSSCTQTLEIKDTSAFARNDFSTEIPFASPEVIRLHEANLTHEYAIGSGDHLTVDIWNRPKLSGNHVVGPYGRITLPIIGVIKIGGLNRKKSSRMITELYREYYEDPIATVKITKYMNNRVYVLGRVGNPGVIHFSGQGTLLEALALAGGLPTRDKTIFLSKCYIVRGKNQIIWIDLLKLLQRANLKLNISLANNDIIYIPESMDAAVFVMGEVDNPGSYQVQTTGLSILDAINLAGGPTEDAQTSKIRLIREIDSKEGVKIINMEEMLAKGDLAQNYLLLDNDIIYIPKKGIATFNYYLRQIDPFLRTFISGTIIKQGFED